MKAKEKAKDLFDKFLKNADGVYLRADDKFIYNPEVHSKNAKQCALIAVEEMLNVLFQHHEIDFWKQVKEEIKLL